MSRAEPRWLGRLVVDEAHFRQVREHGGAYGLRDENALESALARPGQRWHHQPDVRLAELAAAYAFALARDHPYIDGNKRVTLVVMVAFLDRNGIELTATNRQAVATVLALAAGEMTESKLVTWVETHSRAATGVQPLGGSERA
ncbi:MAG TPA: type II toxin-antitoxin system death-on-curing family toxin [Candidatus Limnocylindrales bacterium]|nr:type II toxin-antitoxin system death-on-curing family toxin [Candidatus Limnocylindrales bacterium]